MRQVQTFTSISLRQLEGNVNQWLIDAEMREDIQTIGAMHYSTNTTSDGEVEATEYSVVIEYETI